MHCYTSQIMPCPVKMLFYSADVITIKNFFSLKQYP